MKSKATGEQIGSKNWANSVAQIINICAMALPDDLKEQLEIVTQEIVMNSLQSEKSYDIEEIKIDASPFEKERFYNHRDRGQSINYPPTADDINIVKKAVVADLANYILNNDLIQWDQYVIDPEDYRPLIGRIKVVKPATKFIQ
jgi:hypothetical protein